MDDKNRHRDVNKLLKNLFSNEPRLETFQLKELFEQRLQDLSITKNQACKILELENKTLDAVLDGESKKVDFLSILKLSDFLKISVKDLLSKYFNLITGKYNTEIENAKKRSFIVENFDLPQLKKIGLIDSINDFEIAEEKIKYFFGYDNIFEFGRNKVTAALSTGKRKSGKKTLNLWFEAVCKSIDKTPNPHKYDRKALIEYFPKIRANCINVENGLLYVAQKLFRLGVTLIIVPKLGTDLHLRGATFLRGGNPCIALTKYTRFYPTLWWTLIHELFHVLYDWEIIEREKYHFSFDPKEALSTDVAKILDQSKIDEDEANQFATEYLFAEKKLKAVLPHIDEPLFVEKYALENHVHPSFIYNFYLWSYGGDSDYAKYDKYFPKNSYDKLLENFSVQDYLSFQPVSIITRKRNVNLNYNAI